MQISKYVVAAAASALTLATTIPSASAREQASLWKIQKTLAAKKYVALTHAFEPGIPRWPGFPDETRKTIYWYPDVPTRWDLDFLSRLLVTLASGVSTSIHQRMETLLPGELTESRGTNEDKL